MQVAERLTYTGSFDKLSKQTPHPACIDAVVVYIGGVGHQEHGKQLAHAQNKQPPEDAAATGTDVTKLNNNNSHVFEPMARLYQCVPA